MWNGSRRQGGEHVRCNEGILQGFKRFRLDLGEFIELLLLIFFQLAVQWLGVLREVWYEAVVKVA